MIAFLKRIWAAAPIASIVLAISIAAGLFFAGRATLQWVYWSDPARREQPIAGWMTPGYVVHSWSLPRDIVATTLSLERREGRPQNLAQIARDRGVPLQALIDQLEAAIVEFRAENPPRGDDQK